MPAREELRSIMMEDWGQCVVTSGTLLLLLWCVDSWNVEELLLQMATLFLSRRQDRISNRGNAKVGAGSRQRGYRKAGRVKKQAANGQSI